MTSSKVETAKEISSTCKAEMSMVARQRQILSRDGHLWFRSNIFSIFLLYTVHITEAILSYLEQYDDVLVLSMEI